MSTGTLPTTFTLERPWLERALDAVQHARQAWRDQRIARRAIDEALELPEQTLRDMGAPAWLQVQAHARREAARLDQEMLRLHDQIASRYH
jgi:hypothetical protein